MSATVHEEPEVPVAEDQVPEHAVLGQEEVMGPNTTCTESNGTESRN